MTPRRPLVALVGVVLLVVAACAGEVSAPAGSSRGAPLADEALPPAGVPDRGDDPAVVAIDVGGQRFCSGALVAPDAVLTARRCTSAAELQACPDGSPRIGTALPPQSLAVLIGDAVTGAAERARGRQIVVPDGDPSCGPDVALVLLDTPIDDIQPMSVRATGAARGDALRTVAFERPGGSALDRLVRDHAVVVDVTPAELHVSEACLSSAGGPAIDESTVAIVGVASRSGGSACAGTGAFDVYARADALLPFIADSLARLALPPGSSTGEAKTKKGAVDVGATCVRGEDCAAGVCVTDGSHEYCSRTCDARDRCPTHFTCKRSADGSWVCAE